MRRGRRVRARSASRSSGGGGGRIIVGPRLTPMAELNVYEWGTIQQTGIVTTFNIMDWDGTLIMSYNFSTLVTAEITKIKNMLNLMHVIAKARQDSNGQPLKLSRRHIED